MQDKKLNLMVGIFVGLGSVLIFIVIILLGQERSIFESTTKLYIGFEDVGGLKPGSQVRLAGVVIGSVRTIDFSQSLADKKLHVEISVRTDMMPRIRKDSIATIGTKGLLGDKIIDISIGSQEVEELREGAYLESEEPPDMFKILESGQSLISNGAEVAKGLKKAIAKFTDEETEKHIKGIIESIDAVLNEIESGDGVAHGLIYDSKINRDLKSTMSEIRVASASAKRTIVHAEDVAREIREGQGTIHGLVYDEDGKKILENVRKASATIAEVVAAIKEEKGMLHTLIYEEDTGNIVRNLEEATRDIQKLAAYIEAGHGTIGGLIKDPTVYEDLKLVLGNIKRNTVLKSLIRMAIENQESKEPNDDENRTSPEDAGISADPPASMPEE